MNTPAIRRVLGMYEILAGVGGIILIAVLSPMLVQKVDANHRVAVISVFLATGCVFVVVLLAGVLLLRNHRGGILVSALVQVAQIPLWALGPSRWVFFAGVYLALLWRPGTSTILAGLKANVDVNWQGSQDATFIGINLVPIVALYFLRRLTFAGIEAPVMQESAHLTVEIR